MAGVALVTSGQTDGNFNLSNAAGAIRDDFRLNQQIARLWKEALVQRGLVITAANDFNQLDRLPVGFSMYKKPRAGEPNTRPDIMIYGHPSHKVFRSYAEFLGHWVYLELCGGGAGCPCCICTGNKRRRADVGVLRVAIPTSLPQLVVRAAQPAAAPTPQQLQQPAVGAQPTLPPPFLPATVIPPAALPGVVNAPAQNSAQVPNPTPQAHLPATNIPLAPALQPQANAQPVFAAPTLGDDADPTLHEKALSDGVWLGDLHFQVDDAILSTRPPSSEHSNI
ncbi:hypothetical protein CLAFUR4_09921 [Fulvia fulva]|nr:hypothetical protein CLAFUR4_09921 [Fulvia fulva]WPV33769.1 hypothetical protein CLAFUW7_09918 [Fulvia fulva]